MKINCKIVCLFLIMVIPQSTPYHQPVKRIRRQNGIGRPLSGGGIICSNPHSPQNIDQKKSMRQYLCNQQDYIYIGAVNVGNPAQTLYVTFDTGSADTWLMTDECRTRSCLDSGVSGGVASRFMTSKSSTFRPSRSEKYSFEYSYGGTIKGYAAQDTFCLGGVSCLQNFDFLAGDDVDWNNRFVDGLVGLSYSADADLKGKRSLLDRLADNGVLKEKLFALWLSRNTSHDQEGGEITFGYTNSSRYIGPIDYIPVIEKRLWKVRLYDVLVWDNPQQSGNQRSLRSLTQNRRCPTSNRCQIIFDLGTSFIVGPDNATGRLIDEWYRKGWVYKRPDDGKWALKDCSVLYRLPNLVFQFTNQREYILTPRDYTFIEDPDFDDKCDLKLAMDTDSDPDLDYWILGSVFLGKFYTIFDFGNDRVGLAIARH